MTDKAHLDFNPLRALAPESEKRSAIAPRSDPTQLNPRDWSMKLPTANSNASILRSAASSHPLSPGP